MSLAKLASLRKRRLESGRSTGEETVPTDEPATKRNKSGMNSGIKGETGKNLSSVPRPESEYLNLSLSPNTPESKPVTTIHLTHSTGDIFASPPNTLIIHACNCEGSWGAGIAKVFRERFPAAFEVYVRHCRAAKSSEDLIGTALLIPPQEDDYTVRSKFQTSSRPSKARSVPNSKSTPKSKLRSAEKPKVGINDNENGSPGEKAKINATKQEDEEDEGSNPTFVGCLFTSRSKGRKKDSKDRILTATAEAVEDLVRAVRELEGGEIGEEGKKGSGSGVRIAGVRMCKINSGLFGVPWEETRAVLEGIEAEGSLGEIEVISLPEK